MYIGLPNTASKILGRLCTSQNWKPQLLKVANLCTWPLKSR